MDLVVATESVQKIVHFMPCDGVQYTIRKRQWEGVRNCDGIELPVVYADSYIPIFLGGYLLESEQAASAEEITQCSAVEEEPAYGRQKTRYAQREREGETQRGITLLSKVCATVTNEQQPLQSHFIQ